MSRTEPSVASLPWTQWQAHDLAQRAVDNDGRERSLAWSAATHELYTWESVEGEDRVVVVLGKCMTKSEADALVAATRVALPTGGGTISIVLLQALLATEP